MNTTIILIGPMCAGKRTIARLLAKELDRPYFGLDDSRWDYYSEIGYDAAMALNIAKSDQGMVGLLNYWKPFEIHAVERSLADHLDCILDFGAGHSVYEDEALFDRVERALAPYPNVIILLPTADLGVSVKILNARFGKLLLEEVGNIDDSLFDVNEQFARHPSNHQLAKMTVYTENKSPEETCSEILHKLGNSVGY